MRLKEIRESRSMTQAELAEDCGVTQGVVSMWEIGLCNPGLDNIRKLARILAVTVDELIGTEDDNGNP